ncbi:MAG: xanthine dehydrogenase family protein molybdopterin-binding subunit [Bacillota bacterium]
MSKKYVGQGVKKVDAQAKVTGEARYTEDIIDKYDDLLHLRVLRAPHPHAYLKSLDTTKAEEVPGVVGIYTAADFPELSNFGLIIKDQPVLIGIGEKMRYLGDALALVVAETDEAVLIARDKIEVEIEELEVISDPRQAMKPNSLRVHENHLMNVTHYIDPEMESSNILCDHYIEKGDVNKGFAEADIIVENEFTTQFLDQLPLQVEKGVAEYDQETEVITIWAASQWLHDTQADMAQALGVSKDKIRIKQPVIGGAFGKKEDISVHLHLALAARETGRPVALIYNREESMITQSKRHPMIIRHKTGVTNEGKLTAWQTTLIGDTGAYASSGVAVVHKGLYHCTGPYEVDNVRGVSYTVYTNNTYCGAMRGFGATQMGFAYDSQMDIIANKLDMDPAEFRFMNAYRPGSTTPNSQQLNKSVNVRETIEKAVEISGWKEDDSHA